MRIAAVVDGADCIDDDSCSVEELQALLEEVKSKAAEIKELEAKLTALNKDDSSTLKQMLAAEELAARVLLCGSSLHLTLQSVCRCELNGFDGCAAWYYDN